MAVNSVLRIGFDRRMRFTWRVKTCDEIRLDNLRLLIAEAGGEEALALKYGCTTPYIKQMARGYKDSKSGSPKGIGDSAARMLEQAMDKERGWMDHDHPVIACGTDEAPADCTVTQSADEFKLMRAFRSAPAAQRAIAMSWAQANLPPEEDVFSEAAGSR